MRIIVSGNTASACAWPLLIAILLVLAPPVLAAAPARAAPAQSFTVEGDVAREAAWNVNELRHVFAGDIHTIGYTLFGKRHTAHGIPLLAIVRWSRPRINPRIKHHSLQFVVEVIGGDGYAADFSLGELSPEIGNEPVWVAYDEDGAPLAADHGPVQIICPRDVRPARWVHQVATIEVVDMAAAANSPTGS